jgi:hypothetical protein
VNDFNFQPRLPTDTRAERSFVSQFAKSLFYFCRGTRPSQAANSRPLRKPTCFAKSNPIVVTSPIDGSHSKRKFERNVLAFDVSRLFEALAIVGVARGNHSAPMPRRRHGRTGMAIHM